MRNHPPRSLALVAAIFALSVGVSLAQVRKNRSPATAARCSSSSTRPASVATPRSTPACRPSTSATARASSMCSAFRPTTSANRSRATTARSELSASRNTALNSRCSPRSACSVVEWNFQKYLVDRNGNVVARFESETEPDDPALVAAVERLLSEPTGATEPKPTGATKPKPTGATKSESGAPS